MRRLHLDPQLRRRRLTSRPSPTRSPPRPSRRAGAGVAALGARRRLRRGRAGLQGLGTAPPTRGCTVAAAAVALRLLPRLPERDRVEPARRRRRRRRGASGAPWRPRSDAPLGAARREGAGPPGLAGWLAWRASREIPGARGGVGEIGGVRGARGESWGRRGVPRGASSAAGSPDCAAPQFRAPLALLGAAEYRLLACAHLQGSPRIPFEAVLEKSSLLFYSTAFVLSRLSTLDFVFYYAPSPPAPFPLPFSPDRCSFSPVRVLSLTTPPQNQLLAGLCPWNKLFRNAHFVNHIFKLPGIGGPSQPADCRSVC